MKGTLVIPNWIYACCAMFIALTCYGLYHDFYYALLIPFGLLVLWAAIYHLEWLFFFVTLCTPLSINLEDLKIGGVGMYLPTEPLLAGMLILLVLKLLSGKSIDRKILRHPMSYVIYAYLIWMGLTSITSELPMVSFKFMATRMWFIASAYFIGAHIFSSLKNIRLFFLLYLFPLIAVIVYTIARHSQYGFDKDSAHWVMEPLFKDHTSYGAVLAMFFPISIALLLQKKMNTLLRVLLIIGFLILTAGIILSYTRAAWISIIGAAGILALMLLRVRLRTIVGVISIAGLFTFLAWDDIQVSLERNKQESSDKLEEHVSSISNVSSDASNLERLNRWHCALEMFKERPLLGWGPGTYQFVYAPFQRSKDRTIISTNQGNGGNAHSEYLGPLCEEGVLGSLLFIAILVALSIYSFRLFYTMEHGEAKMIVAASYLGLMTYFIHGVLNNYLDTDKASIPFWGFIAAITAVDIYHQHKTNATKELS